MHGNKTLLADLKLEDFETHWKRLVKNHEVPHCIYIGPNHLDHDYYSIWFNLSAAFFIPEKKTGIIKTKNPLFHLVPCHEMLIIVLNCLYIWNIIKYFLNIKLKVKSLNYFHECFCSLEMGSSNYLPLFTLNGLARSNSFAKVWKVWNGSWLSSSGLRGRRRTYLTI
jgi:hypothetical protein